MTTDSALAAGFLMLASLAGAHMAFVRYLRRTDRRPSPVPACCRRCELARGRR